MHSSNPDAPIKADGSAKSEPTEQASSWGLPELSLLADLGFGPASQLMTEPKLFVDARFLAALQVEFEEELGAEGARTVMFQIGLIHGLRDALQASDLDQITPGAPDVVSPSPLAMRFGSLASGDYGLETSGCWPDGHEAEARISRLGATDHHVCALSAGYTSGWLSGAFDVDMLTVETSCGASGAGDCTFRAREVDAWIRDPSPLRVETAARALLEQVSIPQLRRLVETRWADGGGVSGSAIERLTTSVDQEDPAVHVWGPVMVMPYIDVETAHTAVELLGRDPAMQAVRVVVLDLGGAIVDDGFGAAGLEQLIGEVEGCGSDVIVTGISPLSEDVIADLETAHLLVRKDLPEAIAYAFQVADAHRQLL